MKGGIGNLMKQAQQMQANMQKAQAEMAQMEVSGEAGGGMVRVIINGKHEARKIELDPKMLASVADDKEMLEDLIAAAFNDAVHKLESQVQQKFSGVLGGMNLPPGFKMPF